MEEKSFLYTGLHGRLIYVFNSAIKQSVQLNLCSMALLFCLLLLLFYYYYRVLDFPFYMPFLLATQRISRAGSTGAGFTLVYSVD